jgi:hypothetical protein
MVIYILFYDRASFTRGYFYTRHNPSGLKLCKASLWPRRDDVDRYVIIRKLLHSIFKLQ